MCKTNIARKIRQPRRRPLAAAIVAVAILASALASRAADAPAGASSVKSPSDQRPITLLFAERTAQLQAARVEGDALSIPVADLTAATGLDLKPQGICHGQVCLRLAPDVRARVVRTVDGAEWVSLTALAEHLRQFSVALPAERVWAFGEIPDLVATGLESAAAPDFTLPDRAGKAVQLSDFRGKKVVLLTWASWCMCSRDLPGWQKLYEELRDKNFELIAAAEDTQGEEAAGKYYDRAAATFTTLLDPEHTVSSLYHMVNVPTGVWIDEQGTIVRPPEVAYTTAKFLGQEVGGDRYLTGIRDWVAQGAASKYVVPAEQLQSRLQRRPPQLAEATTYFRLGVHFQQAGQPELADRYWRQAQTLYPDNWNFHRQDWAFTPQDAMTNWMRKFQALEGKPYYEPLDLPAEK